MSCRFAGIEPTGPDQLIDTGAVSCHSYGVIDRQRPVRGDHRCRLCLREAVDFLLQFGYAAFKAHIAEHLLPHSMLLLIGNGGASRARPECLETAALAAKPQDRKRSRAEHGSIGKQQQELDVGLRNSHYTSSSIVGLSPESSSFAAGFVVGLTSLLALVTRFAVLLRGLRGTHRVSWRHILDSGYWVRHGLLPSTSWLRPV